MMVYLKKLYLSIVYPIFLFRVIQGYKIMMQQVATSKTSIATPASAQNNNADEQQQGGEFAEIFRHQETRAESKSPIEKSVGSQKSTEADKPSDKIEKEQAAEGGNKSLADTEQGSSQPGSSEENAAGKEHDSTHNQELEAKESKQQEAGADDESETKENDDLLSLLQASHAAEIKHNKVADGDEEFITDPTKPAIDAAKQSTKDGEQQVKASSMQNKDKLPEVKLTPELQKYVDELSTELKLTAEQQDKLTGLVQQLSQKADKADVNINKAEVKLLATLTDGTDTDAELAKLTRKLTDKEVGSLLNLPEDKADKVIQQVAAMLGQNQKTGAKSGDKTDFVSNLKAGLAEIKQQLQQGHEPGIDLKSLIQQAMSKTNEAEVQIKPEQLTQVMQKMTQVLDVAGSREQNTNQVLSMANNDRNLTMEGQLRADAARQTSQTSLQGQVERPINILKPEGHQQLANKVQMMVNQKNMVAEIRLDPPDLGSMSIKINMQGEQASVSFVVQSQQAQNTLEQSTPRLREMLAERGIELGQSSVQQDSQGKQTGQDGEQGLAGNNQQAEGEETEDSGNMYMHTRVVNGAVGGIDFFA